MRHSAISLGRVRHHLHPSAPLGVVLALLAWSLLAVQPCGTGFASVWIHHHPDPAQQGQRGGTLLHAGKPAPVTYEAGTDVEHHNYGLPHDMVHCLMEEADPIELSALLSADGENPSKVDPSLVGNAIPLLEAPRSASVPSAPARASPLNRQYLLTLRLRL